MIKKAIKYSIALLIILPLILMQIILFTIDFFETPEQKQKLQAHELEKKESQDKLKAAQALDKEIELDRHNKTLDLSRAIMVEMRDPNSFKIESAAVSQDRKITCITYRAKNGFGGFISGVASSADKTYSTNTEIFERRCTSKDYLFYPVSEKNINKALEVFKNH